MLNEKRGQTEEYCKPAFEAQAKRRLYGEATAQMPLGKTRRVTLEDDQGLQPEDPEELTLRLSRIPLLPS